MKAPFLTILKFGVAKLLQKAILVFSPTRKKLFGLDSDSDISPEVKEER